MTTASKGILDRLKAYTMRAVGMGAITLAALANSKQTHSEILPYAAHKKPTADRVMNAELPSPLEMTLDEDRTVFEGTNAAPDSESEGSYAPATPLPLAQETLEKQYGMKNRGADRQEEAPSIKAILNGKAYAENTNDSDSTGISGNGKLILDFGDVSMNLYGNAFTVKQDFEKTKVDGSGSRVYGGASVILQPIDDIKLLFEGNIGHEKRDYTVESKTSGKTFDFGNESLFYNVKAGLTEKKIDDEDFGVGNSHNWMLVQYTRHGGTTTGDVEDKGFGDDYKASRWKAQARWMIPDTDFSFEAGASTLDERMARFLSRDDFNAQAGVRYHFSNPGYVEVLGLHQDSKTEIAGQASNERIWGFQIGTGWRLIHGNAALDANALYGHMDDGTNYGAVGVTVTLGSSK